jgi:hypothetical protein
MALADAPIGSSAVLRLSGCPIRLWLAGANPELFSLVRALGELQEEYTSLGTHLAERIGIELVPHPSLSHKDRALALGLRRQLYNGLSVRESSCRQLSELARHLVHQADQLIGDLETATRASEKIKTLQARLSQVTMREQARLPQVAWKLVASMPLTRALLRHRDPVFCADIEERLRCGDPWESKTMRRCGEYLWKIIDRAATKSTPRDLHSHVALLLVSSDVSEPVSIAVTEEFATRYCENIHSLRLALSSRPLKEAAPNIRLAVTPLRWEANDHLQFWVVDPDNPTRLVEVQMRRTSLLDIIYTTLAPGAKTLQEFEAAILLEPDEEQRDLLQKFVEYLIGLGVLQVSSPPRCRLESWHPLAEATAEECREDVLHAPATCPAFKVASSAPELSVRSNLMRDAFLDVYRRTTMSLPLSFCMRLQRLFEQAQRVLMVIEADRLSATGGTRAMPDERPKPILELLRERMLATTTSNERQRRPLHWPPALTRDSAYSRLLSFISSRADESAVVDLDRTLFDDLGAPNGMIDWPTDCVLRVPCPGAGFEAVLHEAFPAGSLDARFVSALRSVNGAVPCADSYYQFLDLLEQESGTTFLELLIPPLSVGAANAVQRPIYTRAWTGDPDIATYCADCRSMPRYVPLSAISLRRVGGRLLAEADGNSVCPVYHATRMPLAPWNILAESLLAAAPLPMRWSPRRLHHSLDAFPERNFMPRITVAGQLVLTCAQWRLSSDVIWDPDSGTLAKVKALEQLRERQRLPRWVFVSTGTGSKPMPCDLESVRAIRTLEHAAKVTDRYIIVVEMLPTPDQLLVSDHVNSHDRLASEIMLRLPCDESPSAMACRLAPAFAQATR